MTLSRLEREAGDVSNYLRPCPLDRTDGGTRGVRVYICNGVTGARRIKSESRP